MIDLSQSTILPVWVVAPMAVATLLVLAAHLTLLRDASMPESRRRIRTANGVLMLFLTPLIAYLFGVATPSEPAVFVIGWTAATAMLGMILLLAVLDMLNTARLHRAELRRIRRETLEAARAERLARGGPGLAYHGADEP